ncbi:phenylalanyl-tRNA synthetase, beta subunit [Neorickettsia risticii str. Illinois]|uniref:Phenylalanine--tRNA ligase beta subunit n=1 Tax=Neorickettsia risticii (strain Illinois) TaxID=434131 RepID=C6V4S0_NEORI|nr:phenylalanine--tRNA ligase subunit beta [Neorickettsia risticii]ACT69385.1 phenylalanyl-tRNA synthetase, beta subunit [Neorickettsia risticii str. Illinois]
MKFTFGWLLEHLDTTLSLEQIVEALISLGFEVENCHSIGRGFVVAQVTECRKHPGADRLTLCKVFDGTQELQIVCGAPNVRGGLKVVLAQVGAVLPSNMMKIKKSKIRGCESLGMLCSIEELGLPGGDNGGIIELSDDYRVGDTFTVDPLIEIAVTPNRGDVLSVHGVARELAAGGYGVLIDTCKASFDGLYAECNYKNRCRDSGEAINITANHDGNVFHSHITGSQGSAVIDELAGNLLKKDTSVEGDANILFNICDTTACRKFSGLVIRNVKNCISPDWLRSKLERVGVKSISALVDIANYVMFSYGSPLHIYDLDKIAGETLQVSVSNEESYLAALNDKEYRVPPGSIIIRDRDMQLQAVAGIIGSKLSACTLSTRNIFVEAAVFDPVMVASTKRAMKINTESAYRFERGVDPDFTEKALGLAAQLISDVCAGKKEKIESFFTKNERKFIDFSLSFFTELTGIEIDSGRAIQILKGLGFEVHEIRTPHDCTYSGSYSDNTNIGNRKNLATEDSIGDTHVSTAEFGVGSKKDLQIFRVVPPSWRNDVTTQACIVEELLRVYGYAQLRSTPLKSKIPVIFETSKEDRIRELLLNRGFSEVVTWPFMSEKKCSANRNVLHIKNPLGAEFNVMRPSIVPNLLEVAQRNIKNGLHIIKIFEIGKIYSTICEEKMLAGLMCGDSFPRNMHEKAHKMDFFDAKADVEALLTSLDLGGRYSFEKCDGPSIYHPGKVANVKVEGREVGFIGELHPRIASNRQIIVFELFLAKLACSLKLKENTFGKFPIVERDFSFVFDLDKVPLWGDIERGLYLISDFIKNVTLFDKYEGDFKGKRMLSLAFLVSMENQIQGLSQEEIKSLSDQIICFIEEKFSGTLRLSC